jgi:hypothetical protein
MPQPATSNKRATPSVAHDDLHAQLTARTRSLFALLTAAHGGSRRAAARETAIDPRCLSEIRGIPTIGFVARIGHGLGLDATHATGVVATSPRSLRSRSCVREAIRRADLLDDVGELSRLAGELQQAACEPSDLGLSQLAVARTLAARGDAQGASVAVDLAARIGLSKHDASCIVALAQAIEAEAAIAAAWSGNGAGAAARIIASRLRTLRGARSFDACERSAVDEARARSWSLSAEVLARPTGATSEHALCDLLRELDAASDPASIAWTASIAGETALVLRKHDRRVGLRAIVRCQLALDEALASAEDGVRGLLLRRRTRLALFEWSTRVALDEIDADTIDGVDADELARIGMWFPEALRDPRFVTLMQKAPRNKINNSRHQAIDASSMHGGMSGQVQGLHALGAVAGSRSEDPC